MSDIKSHPAENILKDSLMEMMTIEVTINEENKVWILHDTPFPDKISHAEFHEESGDLYFMFEKGETKHLGVPLPESLRPRIAKAKDADCIFVKDQKDVESIEKIRLESK